MKKLRKVGKQNIMLCQWLCKMKDRTIKVTNPFSGQSEMLNDEEYLLYLNIKDAEWAEQYTVMQKGLDKFSRLNAKAYMTLLD